MHDLTGEAWKIFQRGEIDKLLFRYSSLATDTLILSHHSFSTFTAHTLNSGILPMGSKTVLVSRLAAASKK